MAELKQQRQQTSSFLGPEQVYTNVSLGNSEAVFGLRVAVPESALAHSSFPWQEYTQRPVSDLWAPEERRGKAYIFFPVGMTNNALDDTFGEDIGVTMDDVPGLLDFTRRAFTFRPEYQEGAQALIARARQEYRRRHGKRKKVTFVGIHNRRGDHMDFQAEVKEAKLQASKDDRQSRRSLRAWRRATSSRRWTCSGNGSGGLGPHRPAAQASRVPLRV
jgi:hypothetical protein